MLQDHFKPGYKGMIRTGENQLCCTKTKGNIECFRTLLFY